MVFYGVPDLEHLETWELLGIPFEYQDFMWPHILEDAGEIRRRVRVWQSLQRSGNRDIMHGPFLDITVHSQDPLIRRISDYRIRQVCDIACSLNAGAIVLHTNFIPNFYDSVYRQNWAEKNADFLTGLLEEYTTLNIYMENMFDEEPDCLIALAGLMGGKRFGICLDLAHAHISGTRISAWNESCFEAIRYYHLNDNFGRIDEHLPLGDGNIEWPEIFSGLRRDAGMLIEVDSLEKYLKSMEYIKRMELCPAEACVRQS